MPLLDVMLYPHTTGIWRPRLLAKAWKGQRSHSLTCPLTSLHWPYTARLTNTSTHLLFSWGVCACAEQVMGMGWNRSEMEKSQSPVPSELQEPAPQDQASFDMPSIFCIH